MFLSQLMPYVIFKILNVIFHSYESHSIYCTLIILHLFSPPPTAFGIACIFDEMVLDIHNVESRPIQKLI